MIATDTRLERVTAAWRLRLLANGVQPYDYETTVAGIQRFEDWPRAWAELAQAHERRAEAAEATGTPATVAHFRRLAALAWHFGYFAHPRPLDAWLAAQRRKARLFRQAAPQLWPPAEHLAIPFDSLHLPAYLRTPPGQDRPPVVLVVSGLDSTKEEHTTFEDVLLRRGLATLTFDGPGQGEVWEHQPGIVDWERAASAVIDVVEHRADLDRHRIGILGVSLGGYLAARCAALDARIGAAVVCGGLFDLGSRELTDGFHAPRVLHFWKANDMETLRPTLARATLDGVIQRLDRPLLVVHGERDDITPVAGARRIYDLVPGPKDWVLFPEGTHVCNNIPHVYRPLVADWLAAQLGRLT